MLWTFPPIVIAMRTGPYTWKTLWGRLVCWWHNDHPLEPKLREDKDYRVLGCPRCGMWVQILNEVDLQVVIEKVTYKKIYYAYAPKQEAP